MDMSNKKTGVTVAVMGIALGLPSLIQAQTPETDKPGFFPSVEIAYKHDDNIFRQENNEESDNIFSVSPDLVGRWFLGKHRLTAQYQGDYATYDTNDDENYDDHAFNADLFLDLTPKFNIDLQANHTRGHEARGSAGIIPGVATKPNEWKENRLFGQLTYGRRIANAQFQLEVEGKELDYTNNNQGTRDRDTDTITGRFFYKIGPKTSAILEATHRDIDYTDSGAPRDLDSTERFYHVGLRWEATYKTTGELKLGRFEKDLDSAIEEDTSGTSVIGTVTWEPRTYSRFTFTALRQPNEAATADSSYTSELVSADWQHDFSSRVTLNANLSDGTDKYTGTREDDLFNAGLGVNYAVLRWLNIGANYSYSERDSNALNASYDDNLYMLNVSLTAPR